MADGDNHRIQKFTDNGTFVTKWGGWPGGSDDGKFDHPHGLVVDNSSYVYVADTDNNRIQKFTSSGTFVTKWGGWPHSGDGNFDHPLGIAVDNSGYVYVADTDNDRVQKFTDNGTFVTKWGTYGEGNGQWDGPCGIAVNSQPQRIYVADGGNNRVEGFCRNWTIRLNQVDEVTLNLDDITDNKTSRSRYLYDDYGNVITKYLDGDTSTNDDDATIHRVFYPNTTANILSKPARERVYATITGDVGGSNLKTETLYYYDGNNTSYTTPPDKGNLTRLEQKKDASSSVSSNFTYDSYGNMLTSQDPNGNTTSWTYETTHHTYPQTKTYPVTGLSENYTWDAGAGNLLGQTDVNGQTTTYQYDTFKRLAKVIRPGDNVTSPSIEYQYNNWGTLNQQHIKTVTKVSDNDTLWQSQYFDGLGRIVQTQARGETGWTIISSTTAFNNRGLVDKQYVSQGLQSTTPP